MLPVSAGQSVAALTHQSSLPPPSGLRVSPRSWPSGRVVDNDAPCDSYNERFSGTLELIGRTNIPYDPFGANSNATVQAMLERAGIRGVKPVVRAPDWNTPLF